MSSIKKIKYFLTHTLQISNKESEALIFSEKIRVNNKIILNDIVISEWDEIAKEGQILQQQKEKLYYLFNKPKGIESTLNTKIEDAVVKFLPPYQKLFYVGRLDKESEGLMLFTNDGITYKKMMNEGIEKEYFVKIEPQSIDEIVNETFKEKMENGILIMGKITNKCKVIIVSDKDFIITLKEGKNRQIRRMCHKLGMNVVFLKRLRIGNLHLDNLNPGELKKIAKEDFTY
jgi:23S rRNA pseudouridine2604 synthase